MKPHPIRKITIREQDNLFPTRTFKTIQGADYYLFRMMARHYFVFIVTVEGTEEECLLAANRATPTFADEKTGDTLFYLMAKKRMRAREFMQKRMGVHQ